MNEKFLLEKLITDEDFNKLTNFTNHANIFEITGMEYREIKHSNLLAWFLNPLGSHNLGNTFLKKVITDLFEDHQEYFEKRTINIFELLLNEYSDIEIIRELEENIDILVKSKEFNIVLCIENKIKADLSDTQLDKYQEYIEKTYRGYKKVFILLSPSGYEVPENKSKNPYAWLPYSYDNIVNILNEICKQDINIKTKFLIEDYIELLAWRQIVENKELNEILEKINTKYKNAIDLLIEYRNEGSSSLIQHLRSIYINVLEELSKEGKILFKKESVKSNYLIFSSAKMNNFLPPTDNNHGSWNDGTKYKYGVYPPLDKPTIFFELGPENQDEQSLHDMNLIIGSAGNKKQVSKTDRYRRTKKWNLNLDYSDSNSDDINEDNIKEAITKAIEDLLTWESKLLDKLQ
jgi:hypothetical protein